MATATTPERTAARSFVHQHLQSADLTVLVATLRLLYTDGYVTGQHAATVTLERLGVQATATLDGRVFWTDWRPGDPETARLLEAAGDTPGLAGLLHQAEVTIKSVRDGYLNRLGDTLAAGEQCAANEAAGPIPLGDSLPFGSPPVHPLCRCSIVPYLASEMGLEGEPVPVGADDLEE